MLMKAISLIAFCVFGFGTLFSQTIERNVVAVSGDNYVNNGISLSWTLGECVTETVQNSDMKITQGFQQGDVGIVNIIENKDEVKSIFAYPNPTTKYVTLEITGELKSVYTAEFTDMSGQLLMLKTVQNNFADFDAQSLRSGNYLLIVKSAGNNIIGSFKIIKY